MRLLFLNLFNGNSRIRQSRGRQAFPCMGGFLPTVGSSLTRRWFCPNPADPGDPMAPGNSSSPAGNSCRWQAASLKQSWGYLWTKGLRLYPVMPSPYWITCKLSLIVASMCVSTGISQQREFLWEFLNDLTNVWPYLLCLLTHKHSHSTN